VFDIIAQEHLKLLHTSRNKVWPTIKQQYDSTHIGSDNVGPVGTRPESAILADQEWIPNKVPSYAQTLSCIRPWKTVNVSMAECIALALISEVAAARMTISLSWAKRKVGREKLPQVGGSAGQLANQHVNRALYLHTKFYNRPQSNLLLSALLQQGAHRRFIG
jgi:hypothetical protein